MSTVIQIGPKLKRCNRCKTEKELKYFHRLWSARDTYNANCIACRKLIFDEFCKRHKTTVTNFILNRNWKNRLKTKFTTEDFEKLSQEQNYKCRGCDQEKPLVVDHCHKTLEIRGLLCVSCNHALGNVRDNPETLLNLARYLNERERVAK